MHLLLLFATVITASIAHSSELYPTPCQEYGVVTTMEPGAVFNFTSAGFPVGKECFRGFDVIPGTVVTVYCSRFNLDGAQIRIEDSSDGEVAFWEGEEMEGIQQSLMATEFKYFLYLDYYPMTNESLSDFECILSGAQGEVKLIREDEQCGRGNRQGLNVHHPDSSPFGGRRHRRMVNGKDAGPNEFPWQVGFKNRNLDVIFCGGSIISSQWILTAAHCVSHETANSTWAVLGEHDQSDVNDQAVEVQVDQIVIHPLYNRDYYLQYDFALVKLTKRLTWSHEVRPVCLPDENKDFAGAAATASGWGAMREAVTLAPEVPIPDYEGSNNTVDVEVNDNWGTLLTVSSSIAGYIDSFLSIFENTTLKEGVHYSNVLKKLTTLTVLGKDLCAKFSFNKLPIDVESQMCAYEHAGDSCQGDSGGSLITRERDGHFTLIGVVSFGNGCARINHPGFYSRVSTAVRWIKETMAGPNVHHTGSTIITAANEQPCVNGTWYYNDTAYQSCSLIKSPNYYAAYCATELYPNGTASEISVCETMSPCKTTVHGNPCHAFSYEGVHYPLGTCAYMNSRDPRPWCSTSSGANKFPGRAGGPYWDFCDCVVGSSAPPPPQPPTRCSSTDDKNTCCQTSTAPNSYIDPNICWCLSSGASCCPTGTTGRQSPIDLLPSHATVQSSYLANPLTFSVGHFIQTPGKVVNRISSGASAEFIPGSVPSALTVSNGPLTTTYNFHQFHFHWDQSNSVGSEHTLNGRSFALECQLVYLKPPYTSVAQAAASGDPSALAALGIFFNLGTTSPFIQQFTGLRIQPFNSSAPVSIVIGKVFNEIPDVNSYISYNGSLAFPGCQENVIWINFLTPATISATQLAWFRSLQDSNGQPYSPHRPTQALNGRQLNKSK